MIGYILKHVKKKLKQRHPREKNVIPVKTGIQKKDVDSPLSQEGQLHAEISNVILMMMILIKLKTKN